MTTTVKTCFKCDEEKPLRGFYRHPQMADGHLNKCKECTKRDVRRHRRNPKYRDRVLAYDRERGSGQDPEYGKEMRAKYPRAAVARYTLGNAVRDGKVVRPALCESCNDPGRRIEAHHDDYSKPLDVRWLCSACHKQWHAKHGPGKNRR